MKIKNDPIELLMMFSAAADWEIDGQELQRISNTVEHYPHWKSYGDIESRLQEIKEECQSLVDSHNSQYEAVEYICSQVDQSKKELAYAFCFEICASNLVLNKEEVEFLKEVASYLSISPEISAAISKSIQIRYFTNRMDKMSEQRS
jgi:hypothetical protein